MPPRSVPSTTRKYTEIEYTIGHSPAGVDPSVFGSQELSFLLSAQRPSDQGLCHWPLSNLKVMKEMQVLVGGSHGTPLIRILIADDHEIVRSGLRSVLDAQPNWEVVAEAADGKEAIVKAMETRPNVAVIDYSLPLINGIEVTRQIHRRLPSTEVLIFTRHDQEMLVDELLTAGARGYLLKSDAIHYLIEAIDALAAHKPFFTSQVSEALLRSFLKEPRRPYLLTPREREVVQLIAEGHTNKQITRILRLSLKTVEAHRSAVMRKLNLSSSTALVRYAVRNKFVEP